MIANVLQLTVEQSQASFGLCLRRVNFNRFLRIFKLVFFFFFLHRLLLECFYPIFSPSFSFFCAIRCPFGFLIVVLVRVVVVGLLVVVAVDVVLSCGFFFVFFFVFSSSVACV